MMRTLVQSSLSQLDTRWQRGREGHAPFSLTIEEVTARKMYTLTSINEAERSYQLRLIGPMISFWDTYHQEIIEALDEAKPQSLHVLIDSPGGFFDSGLALYADLTRRRGQGVQVTTEAVGVVASAATLPFLAGESRKMADGSSFMIHDVMLFGGDVYTIRNVHAEMEKLYNSLQAAHKQALRIYSERSGQSMEQLDTWVEAETWMTEDEAYDRGFATETYNREAKSTEDPTMTHPKESHILGLLQRL